jgi:hypothetical protein
MGRLVRVRVRVRVRVLAGLHGWGRSKAGRVRIGNGLERDLC